MSTSRRVSAGGGAVEKSLIAAGFDTTAPSTTLIETARPRKRGFARVLAQNAWTVLPPEEYERLSARYSAKWRARMAARRAIAKVNMTRTEAVVCLTHTMGELVQKSTKTPVIVAQSFTPTDLASPSTPTSNDRPEPPSIVVPGTLTWYKRPQLAVRIARDIADTLGRDQTLLFLGEEDGSGAWDATLAEANRLGVPVRRKTVGRSEMFAYLTRSTATIVPSALESLSFCLTEALALSPMVISSRIEVHHEVSMAMNRSPLWLEDWPSGSSTHPTGPPDIHQVQKAWEQVGNALELPST